jgi:hypothetical protein
MKHFLLLLMAVAALACPPNCLNCDASDIFCLSCTEGYEWKQTGTCVDANTVPKCTVYGLQDECLECQPTYVLKNGKCEKEYSGCLVKSPTDPSMCSACGFGTLLQNYKCL